MPDLGWTRYMDGMMADEVDPAEIAASLSSSVRRVVLGTYRPRTVPVATTGPYRKAQAAGLVRFCHVRQRVVRTPLGHEVAAELERDNA